MATVPSPAQSEEGEGGEGRGACLSIKQAFHLVAVVSLTFGLAACSTGRVNEARVAATREATRGAGLPDVQATRVVEQFFKPTASPEPTWTTPPTLATLTLATSIGSSNQPLDEVGAVRQGSTCYAVAEIHNLQEGQTVIAVWTNSAGGEVGRSSLIVDRSLGAAWVPLPWTANVGPGAYAVYLYVDDHLLNSLVFRVF